MFEGAPRQPGLSAKVVAAVRAAWGRDTCDAVDLADWHPGNPSRGQCGVTALVLQELLGGELLIAEVHHASGERQGSHYWNRLAGGAEVDLTREPFTADEVIGEPVLVARPAGPPARCREQYDRFRVRVLDRLSGTGHGVGD